MKIKVWRYEANCISSGCWKIRESGRYLCLCYWIGSKWVLGDFAENATIGLGSMPNLESLMMLIRNYTEQT